MTYRILHVIPGLGHGGAEHQLLMNVERLEREKFENHICHLYPRTILAPALQEARATVHSGAASGPLGTPLRLWKLVRLIREIKPDLIHTSNVLGEMYGGIAGRLTGVPVVGTLTNTSDREVRLTDNPHLNSFKLRTVGYFRRQLVRRTHARHIAISNHVAESATSELGVDPERISVIYRGVDSDAVQPAESGATSTGIREELSLDSASPLILSVGRLVPQKGQRYLIEAMPAIRDRHPDAVLLLIGIGFLEEKLRNLADELDLQDSVRFLGRREDVPALLQAADIFVFPSLFEGLGVSLLEASGSGTPVIGTNTGPIPEIIRDGETGLLVPPADAEAIANAVSQLADDEDLRMRLGTAARDRVSKNFTIDQAVTMLEEFYETVIEGRSDSLQQPGLNEAG